LGGVFVVYPLAATLLNVVTVPIIVRGGALVCEGGSQSAVWGLSVLPMCVINWCSVCPCWAICTCLQSMLGQLGPVKWDQGIH
jgi:hypothetical protein